MEVVLRIAITDALHHLELPVGDFVIEHPTDLAHGDFACNVALTLARSVGRSPRAIAEEVREALIDQIEYVDRIEVAGPGFLNFYLAREFFAAEIYRAQQLADAWGRNDGWQGTRVVVEYTDPNPFKEFHIGHLFSIAVGESIARLFMMNGAETKRVNYQGDVGLHVACALWGLQQRDVTVDTTVSPQLLGEAYAHGATQYRAGDATVVAEIKRINKAVYDRTDSAINDLYDHGRAVSLQYFESIYDLVDTQFDEYFFESEAGPRGKELVENHPEIFPESDGARVFLGEAYGLHTRVFLNNEGLPTYEAKELALAKLKEERLGGYDLSVISTANEINAYFQVLVQAMAMVYPELAAKTEHIGHGTVRLSSGKMSSRTGHVIRATDFIAEIAQAVEQRIVDARPELGDDTTELHRCATDVAMAAIKYTTLKGSILQDTVFDKSQALSFEGDSGPYLQYTHARICSVLEKAEAAGVAAHARAVPSEPYQIERLLYRFPAVIEAALRDRAPHQVAGYLIDVAGTFNTFYAHEKIADPTDPHAPYKVAVADTVRLTLKNGLWVLGIKAPTRM